MKKQIAIPKDNRFGRSAIEIEISYEKGGYNDLARTKRKRGVYMYVTPVDCLPIPDSAVKGCYISAFSGSTPGWCACLKELGRKSDKAVDKVTKIAEQYFDEIVSNYLVDNTLKLRDIISEIEYKAL